MSSYFSQFVPNFGTAIDHIKHSTETNPDAASKLNYLLVINPELVDSKAETNEALIHQVLCFISNKEYTDLEKLQTIGLIRGIDLFGRDFSDNAANNSTIIQSSKGSIILLNVEPNFYIACSIKLPSDTEKYGYINNQLIKLVQQAYRRFKMLHNTFNSTIKSKDYAVIEQFWRGFFDNFNNQTKQNLINWMNSLNYRGFLGLLPKNTYKRSSLKFGDSSQQEIKTILEEGISALTPKGIVIAYLDKLNPKKYGLIYKNSVTIADDDLIDVYNWLELRDYQNKLTKNSLVANEVSDEFVLNEPVVDESISNLENVTSYTSSALTTNLDMLHPTTLTNNLVILPLNYTMNGMKSLHGMFINSEGQTAVESATDSQPDTSKSGLTSWFSVPPVLKNFHFDTPSLTEREEDIEDDLSGEYLIGLQQVDQGYEISRKSFYFNEVEYSVVIYNKESIFVTLLFELDSKKLTDNKFYEKLQSEILDPSIEEINQSCINTSINGSLASLNSLRKYVPTQLDSEFFFVVYDVDEGWFKSSLPYLPAKSITKLNKAMIYLHDQLTGLFIVKNNRKFFLENDLMNEYFHKFTSNKANDWMFYYIKHNAKVILIIKNQNKGKTAKKLPVEESGILGKLSSGANLGFLDNLGDDVKSWFEKFSSSGEL